MISVCVYPRCGKLGERDVDFSVYQRQDIDADMESVESCESIGYFSLAFSIKSAMVSLRFKMVKSVGRICDVEILYVCTDVRESPEQGYAYAFVRYISVNELLCISVNELVKCSG